MTGNPAESYFVDGMTDELTTSLAQIGRLKVISETSAMHYRGTNKPLRQIAQELSAAAKDLRALSATARSQFEPGGKAAGLIDDASASAKVMRTDLPVLSSKAQTALGGLAAVVILVVYQYRARQPLLTIRTMLTSSMPVAGIAVALFAAAASVSATVLTAAVLAGRGCAGRGSDCRHAARARWWSSRSAVSLTR